MITDSDFFKACKEMADLILETGKKNSIIIFSHLDADGLTAASILGIALARVGLSFNIRILERLEYTIISEIQQTYSTKSTIIFSDIGTGVLDGFLNWKGTSEIFILDHHTIVDEPDLPNNIHHLNPHLFSIDGTTEISGAGVVYLVSKFINPINIDLSFLAIIGALGDRQDQGKNASLIGLNHYIVLDALKVNLITNSVSVWFFDRTRSLLSILQFSELFKFNNQNEIIAFLSNIGIQVSKNGKERSFFDLSKEECRDLASELIQKYEFNENDLYKTDYQLQQEGNLMLKDARVFASKLNSCGRLQRPDIGIALCMGDRKEAWREFNLINMQYKEEISRCIKWGYKNLLEDDKLYVLDGKEIINERLIGTILSMFSTRKGLKDKPLLGFTEIDDEKLKISMRLTKDSNLDIDLSNLLKQTIDELEPNTEVGGHSRAAGAIIRKENLINVINNLKSALT